MQFKNINLLYKNMEFPDIKTNQSIYPSYNAVQINMKKPTVNASQPNVIYDYQQADAQIYYPPINTDTTDQYNVSTPVYSHAFDDCYNMKVLDSQGNIVQNIEYKKDGDKLTEEIFVKCVNGSTVNKTIVNDGNKKSMTLTFKNKNGEITGQENRTYEKLDDDNAISVHNGKTYKISGLSGDVVTVEHNGQKKVIDLGKKIQPTLDTIKSEPTQKQISPEQKEFLLNSVKKLSGDIILKFDEEIDKIVMLDTDQYEGFYNNQNGVRKLKLSPRVKDDMTFIHELGHAIDHPDIDGIADLSENEEFVKAREVEVSNFRNQCKNNAIINEITKFYYDDLIENGSMDYIEGKRMGQDEEFAEMTGFINSMDVDFTRNRTTSMLQFMPESTQMVYKKNQELF